MKLDQQKMLQELEKQAQNQLIYIEQLKNRSLSDLQKRPAPESWSALECVEHLNRYAAFYIPKMEELLKNAPTSSTTTFSPGFLGNMMTKSMQPEAKKMNTFKSMNPLHSDLDSSVLDTFIDYQKRLIALFPKANQVDLGKIKCPISISKMIKLKLGDVFNFHIIHQERHCLQIKRALQA